MPDLHKERLRRWSQTPETRLRDAAAATRFIERVGIATLFPASPEVPNLFHAFVGDPARPTDSKHDSDSGHVYSWRWDLGRAHAAFYSLVVRKRPTWVRWDLLPAILRLRGELRTVDELIDLGLLSDEARRIVQALERAGGALSTGELRRAAGFPTGREQRSSYLKAVEELDHQLILAKVFSPDTYDMSHALVSQRWPETLDAATSLTRPQAIEEVVRTYMPQAVYVVPATLAKHLGIPGAELRAGVDRLADQGVVRPADSTPVPGASHVWCGS